MAPPQARVSDTGKNSADAYGCPACPHSVIGPCIAGSPNVFTNSLPSMRKGDPGIHAACCDGNSWVSNAGSGTVFINGKPATRKGDATKHCGGNGTVTVGSGNVNTGG